MVWLTCFVAGCCKAFAESWSIFFLDSKKIGQSLV
jgi:hypothetical protein